MNKKKYILIAVFVIAFTTVAMAALGNQLTASQFADIDLDKHNFNLQSEGDSILGTGSGAVHRNYFPIDTFEKQPDGSYEEVRGKIFGQFMVQDFALCVYDGETEEVCKQKVRDVEIIDAVNRFEENITTLKGEQRIAAAMALHADKLKAGDIIITAKEVNDAITAAQLEP